MYLLCKRFLLYYTSHQGLAKPRDWPYIASLPGRQVDSEECPYSCSVILEV